MKGLFCIAFCLVSALSMPSTLGSKNGRMDDKRSHALANNFRKLTDRSEDKFRTLTRRANLAKSSWEKLMGLFYTRTWKDDPGCSEEVGWFVHEGELTSPDYPNKYPNEAFCKYLIEAPEGKVVKLEFPEFYLEDQTDCAFDFVSIFDGYNKSYDFLGYYCGNLPGLTFLSESNALFFYFYADEVNAETGFKAVWSFHDAYNPVNNDGGSVSCNQTYNAESGLIQTPVQPGSNQYPNNTRCVYSVTSPSGKKIALRFEQFWLEQDEFCSHDKVEIYDGESVTSDPLLTQVYCGGNIPPDLYSTGPSLTVVFSSNDILTGSGIIAHWSTVSTSLRTPPPPLLIPACGVPRVRSSFLSLIDGAEVIPHSYPWQAQILKNGNHWCGGSIIANLWIVTAAHCVDLHGFKNQVTLSVYSVRVGEHNRQTNEGTERDHAVADIMIYHGYSHNSITSDIAILKMAKPITYNDYVSPICLPTSDPQEGLLCAATGWGETGHGLTDVLMGINVPIISHADCNKEEMHNGSITGNMFCAGYPQTKLDSCLGDSGGPLVCNSPSGTHMTLYGITRGGNDCVQANKPEVYIRVSRFTGWITAKTGVLPPIKG